MELQKLIYGMTGNVVYDPAGSFKDIVEVLDALDISVVTLRQSFENMEYTDYDYLSVFAQASIVYGWTREFEVLTGTTPTRWYANSRAEEDVEPIVFNNPSNISLVPPSYINSFIMDILESKTVLRQNQIQCIMATPLNLLEELFNDAKFTIRETKVLVARHLLEYGKDINAFDDFDMVIRILSGIDGQISNTDLKITRIELYTKLRKRILTEIEGFNKENTLKTMKKYKNFSKKILQQLRWCEESKMRRRYPKTYALKDHLYNNTITTRASRMHALRMMGDFRSAFDIELDDINQCLRNLASYVRYPKGTLIASKITDNQTLSVLYDISDVDSLSAFRDALKFANRKLIHQCILYLSDERNFKEMSSKFVFKVDVEYLTPLPPLDRSMSSMYATELKMALRRLSGAYMAPLGKVYLARETKDFTIPFSGRLDSSQTLSGTYYAPGSTVQLKNADFIRLGIAWRSESSTDLDLNASIGNVDTCYYGNPQIKYNAKVVMASSGDVMHCDAETFSAEFLDIDTNLYREAYSEKILTSVISYSGVDLDDENLECYWFIKVISSDQRITGGAVGYKLNLADMDYAVRLNAASRGALGLLIDIHKMEAKVINGNVRGVGHYNNAEGLKANFEDIMAGLPIPLTVFDAFTASIPRQDIVENKEDADTVVGYLGDYSPSTDMSILIPLIF